MAYNIYNNTPIPLSVIVRAMARLTRSKLGSKYVEDIPGPYSSQNGDLKEFVVEITPTIQDFNLPLSEFSNRYLIPNAANLAEAMGSDNDLPIQTYSMFIPKDDTIAAACCVDGLNLRAYMAPRMWDDVLSIRFYCMFRSVGTMMKVDRAAPYASAPPSALPKPDPIPSAEPNDPATALERRFKNLDGEISVPVGRPKLTKRELDI